MSVLPGFLRNSSSPFFLSKIYRGWLLWRQLLLSPSWCCLIWSGFQPCQSLLWIPHQQIQNQCPLWILTPCIDLLCINLFFGSLPCSSVINGSSWMELNEHKFLNWILSWSQFTRRYRDVMGNTFASRHAAKHRGFAALCYQLLGIPKRMSLLLIPTICLRKFLCNTITKSLSDVIDIMWILNWNEMGVKQEKLTGPPILLWSRIFAQVFNE